jgi:DeoR family transcriptional regulator of aga operon
MFLSSQQGVAEETLHDMHAAILFLGVDGFDLEAGLTTPNVMESRVNRAMVKASSTAVVVCDSTKFNRRSLPKIVDDPSCDHRQLSAESHCDALRGMNSKVTLV